MMHRVWVCWGVGLLVGCGAAASQRASAPPAAGATTHRAQFADAHRAVQARRYAEAVALLEPLCPVYAQLADYCLGDLAVSRAHTGDAAAAEALWTRLATDFPQSIHAPRAQLERGRLRRQAGDLSDARVLFETASRSEDDEVALSALLELADLETASGSVAAADADLMQVRIRAPDTPLGLDAKRRQQALRQAHPELAPHGAAQVTELHLLLKERDFAAARDLADQLSATGTAPERAEVLRVRADAELGAGDVEQALATLQEVVRLSPGSPIGAEAQYRTATLLWNRDRNDEAGAAFRQLAARFPNDPHMPDVLYALARIAQSDGEDEDAIALYTRLADAYPTSGVAHDARWRIGWIRYRAGRYAEAAAAFGRSAAGAGPATATDSYYWQARASQRAGDRAAAERLYTLIIGEAPGSYYADLAERRLGRTSTSSHGITAPPAPQIGATPTGADPYHWIRAAELQAVGLDPLARAEVRAFEREHSDRVEPRAVVAAYQATGDYRDAIRVGTARGLADPAIFFPLAFWPQVAATSNRQGVDPLLVLALMRQESMFDPSARSPADARGLMQLLPSTADLVAQRMGQPAPDGSLYDPDTNIVLGIAHLRELLDGYGGDRVKVLAAYNGGVDAVARWQQRFGDLEPDEFVESITYRETRDYVKRVLGNYRRYQQAYAPPRG